MQLSNNVPFGEVGCSIFDEVESLELSEWCEDFPYLKVPRGQSDEVVKNAKIFGFLCFLSIWDAYFVSGIDPLRKNEIKSKFEWNNVSGWFVSILKNYICKENQRLVNFYSNVTTQRLKYLTFWCGDLKTLKTRKDIKHTCSSWR